MSARADHRSRSGPSGSLLGPGSPVRTALLVLLTYVVLGAVAGVLWEVVWTPPGEVIQGHQVFFDSYASLRREFTGTGFYVVVGAVASALGALVVCLLARGRELLVLFLVIAGSLLAAGLMWRIGTSLGPKDPTALAAHVTGRQSVQGDLRVEGKTPYLTWPMVSLFVLALVYFAWPGASRPGHHVAESPVGDPAEAAVSGSDPR